MRGGQKVAVITASLTADQGIASAVKESNALNNQHDRVKTKEPAGSFIVLSARLAYCASSSLVRSGMRNTVRRRKR
ncbi:hypothetical protein JUNP479_1327 [Aeromonas jandaei]|nr:hypothetical protein JUNP479_1327 [Aeromonas jandaei]